MFPTTYYNKCTSVSLALKYVIAKGSQLVVVVFQNIMGCNVDTICVNYDDGVTFFENIILVIL